MAAFVSTLPLSLALSKTCLDNAYAKSQNKEKERGAQTKLRINQGRAERTINDK